MKRKEKLLSSKYYRFTSIQFIKVMLQENRTQLRNQNQEILTNLNNNDNYPT